MTRTYRVLLISESEALASEVRSLLFEVWPAAALQHLNDPFIASARLGGGDIHMLLIDPPALGAHLADWVRSLPPVPRIVMTGDWESELSRHAATRTNSDPTWIGFIGAKGGAGASTVSLNVAYALAR